jgi:hypothetical protein
MEKLIKLLEKIKNYRRDHNINDTDSFISYEIINESNIIVEYGSFGYYDECFLTSLDIKFQENNYITCKFYSSEYGGGESYTNGSEETYEIIDKIIDYLQEEFLIYLDTTNE